MSGIVLNGLCAEDEEVAVYVYGEAIRGRVIWDAIVLMVVFLFKNYPPVRLPFFLALIVMNVKGNRTEFKVFDSVFEREIMEDSEMDVGRVDFGGYLFWAFFSDLNCMVFAALLLLFIKKS